MTFEWTRKEALEALTAFMRSVQCQVDLLRERDHSSFVFMS